MKDEHVNDINNYQKLYMQYAPMLLRFAGKFISPFFAEDIVPVSYTHLDVYKRQMIPSLAMAA